jgi:hypothetical protein
VRAARPQPDVAGTFIGSVNFVVTGRDGSELVLTPAEFSAVTINVYTVYWVRPVTVTEVPEVVAVTPPGSDVTAYSVMGLPPFEADAVHETTAETSLGIADTLPGALGTLVRVTDEESVVDDTWVPALPAVSLKSIVKATAPSVSPDARTKVAVQSFPLVLA